MGVRGNYIGGIVQKGIVLHLDAGKIDSYIRESTVISDISGNGLTGSLVGFSGRTIFDKENGGSIIFSSTNNQVTPHYITMGDNNLFTQTTGFTFDLYFKPTSGVNAGAVTSNQNPILEKYANTGSNTEYVFGFYNGLLWGWVADNGNSSGYRGRQVSSVSRYVTLGEWCHLAFIWDGGTSNSSVKLYINGTQRDDTDFGGGSFTSIVNTTTPLTFAAQNWGLGGPIKGQLSNIRMYNRALSATEVLQNFNALKSRFVSRGIDSDAQSFLTAALINDAQIANAVNNLVIDLKKYGLWTKMRAIYPVVGGNATAHAVNLKTPGTYNLTFNGTWTHGSTGMTGSTGYANTSITSDVVQTTNHLSFYSRTQTVGTEVEMGIWNASNNTFNQLRVASNYLAGDITNGLINFTTTSDARGFWIGTKSASNSRKGYLNGSLQVTSTTNDTSAHPPGNIYLGARNQINTGTPVQLYSNKQCAFASIGDGLTDTEAANFYTAVQAFQTLLGRQV